MCSKCNQIDQLMARYRWLRGQINDPQTIEAIERLLEKLEAEKRTLHPRE